MTNSFEKEINQREGSQELPKDFFALRGKICFIGKEGLRIEVEPGIYLEAKQKAEALLSKYPLLVEPKIRQFLDDILTKSDEINLKAAETFPDNQELFALMVRNLSPDIPGAELSDDEKAKLEKALPDTQK